MKLESCYISPGRVGFNESDSVTKVQILSVNTGDTYQLVCIPFVTRHITQSHYKITAHGWHPPIVSPLCVSCDLDPPMSSRLAPVVCIAGDLKFTGSVHDILLLHLGTKIETLFPSWYFPLFSVRLTLQSSVFVCVCVYLHVGMVFRLAYYDIEGPL